MTDLWIADRKIKASKARKGEEGTGSHLKLYRDKGVVSGTGRQF